MSSSAQKIREFPALFMTILFIGAALASTGCLRQLTTETQMPIMWSGSDDVQYYAPNYMTERLQESNPPSQTARDTQLANRN